MSDNKSLSSPRAWLQIGGCIIFITGFIELILGSMTYGIVDAAYGAWYAGLVCMISGVLGMTATSPNMRNSAYCFR